MGQATVADNPFPMVAVVCNLCGADNCATIYEGPDRLLGHPGHFRVVQCRCCGLVYQNPRPADIAPFYTGNYGPFQPAARCFATQSQTPAAALGAARSYYHLLAQCTTTPPGRLLDVGCATGDFLHLMHTLGWQVAGCDLSPAAIAIARQQLPATTHHNIRIGHLEEADFPAATFDVVTLWHTLEHLPDPLGTLRAVRRVLRHDGQLIIQTPAWLSLEARLWGRYWSAYDCPRHFFIFSPRTLRDMLHQAGFTSQRSLPHTSYYVWIISLVFVLQEHLPPHFVQRIYSLLHQRWWVRYWKPFFLVIDRSGLGSHLTVCAR